MHNYSTTKTKDSKKIQTKSNLDKHYEFTNSKYKHFDISHATLSKM